MSNAIDELENAAVDARIDVALYRSTYSRSCSNRLRLILKNDFHASTAFQVRAENDSEHITSRYDDNEIQRLGLKSMIPDPYMELDTFGERLKNVSKVLDMVVKQKGK